MTEAVASQEAFARLIERITGHRAVAVTGVGAPGRPSSGFSGADVRVHEVAYRAGDGEPQTARVVVKDAVPLEQNLLELLREQGQAIPIAYIPEPNPAGRTPVYMQYARDRAPADLMSNPLRPLTRKVAAGLARIHVANLGRCPAWLPQAAEDFMGLLYLNATWEAWERCLRNDRFHAEFGRYDEGLRASLEVLLEVLRQLTKEDDTLTLLNVDLNPAHVRLVGDEEPVFIDWEQARYGTLYLDLVNVFNLDTALLYRDALAEAGCEIAPAAFLERFREVGRFMGLRYLGVGLESWQAGGEAWRNGRWFFHYCLTLALRGR